MEKKTVYIHIGSDKTGSTAIQRFSFLNREVLKTYGLHFVSTKYDHHRPLLQAFRNKDSEYIEGLLTEIRTQSSSKYLITFEGLYHLNDDELKAFIGLFREFDLQIIFYIRRRSDLFRSGVAQNLKATSGEILNGSQKMLFDREFGDPTSIKKFDYLSIIRRWQNELFASGFQHSSFNLRIYERSAFLFGDLIVDFYSIFNLCPPEMLLEGGAFRRSAGISNPSISPAAQFLLSLINMVDLEEAKYESIKNIILKNDNNHELNHSVVPDELATRLDDHYQKQDGLLAKEFFNRDQLFLEQAKFYYQEPSAKSLVKLIEGVYREKLSNTSHSVPTDIG